MFARHVIFGSRYKSVLRATTEEFLNEEIGASRPASLVTMHDVIVECREMYFDEFN